MQRKRNEVFSLALPDGGVTDLNFIRVDENPLNRSRAALLRWLMEEEMLEEDAKLKICPYKLGRDNIHIQYCEGKRCMGWEVWMETLYENKEFPYKLTRHKPKDPPEGHCGMIPPELNCGH